MNFRVLSDPKTLGEYIYLAIEGTDLSMKAWNSLLKRINEECRDCGYERIMLDLSALTVPVSVATVYRAASSPIAINLLPFRLAWVNCDEAWLANWKSVELVMRNRNLPWRSFADRQAAEVWLMQDRRASINPVKYGGLGQPVPG